MPAVVRRRQPKAALIKSGPWKRVRTTNDPFDGGDDELIDAGRGYIPDPDNGSGFYALPGFTLNNNGAAITTSASTFRTQGIFSFTSLAGVTANFVVMNGKLWRGDSTSGVFTDVSPAGITIDPGITTRVYGTTIITQCVVTDGVNKPWLLTNPTSSPVTGTYIDYDGSGTTWSAFGPFVEYVGSAICILNQVNSVTRRSDISWSLPANVATGWQQTNYDFNWTLGQSADGTNPPALTALAADDNALTYWRESSIGAVSGTPGPSFRGASTHDQLSKNIGTLSPQSVVQYGTAKFFVDALGRPYRLSPGEDPEPIWLQMRSIVDASSSGFPGVNRVVCTAAFEPTLNLYIVAPWSTTPSISAPATEGYIFDGRTGNYFGRFTILSGVQLDTLGVFIDANGRGVLVAGGSATVPVPPTLATSGFLWGMNSLIAAGDFCSTENASPNLVYSTTEDGVLCTTEGADNTGWTDNGSVPDIFITTPWLGYDINTVVGVDRAVALVNSGASVAVSATTSGLSETAEGTATASTTQDTIGRLTAGFSGIQGRGVTVTLRPTTASAQFICEQIAASLVSSIAPPDEP